MGCDARAGWGASQASPPLSPLEGGAPHHNGGDGLQLPQEPCGGGGGPQTRHIEQGGNADAEPEQRIGEQLDPIDPDGGIARHPSQIYQFLLEGLLLFALLWVFARKERKPGEVGAAFLLGYGLMRFVAEYFREPDPQLGFLWGGLTMGMLLSVPMVLAGVAIIAAALRRKPAKQTAARGAP